MGVGFWEVGGVRVVFVCRGCFLNVLVILERGVEYLVNLVFGMVGAVIFEM